ncbi:MAG: hypothetical protein N3H31_07435 [Candidatus Nezhaarchaeota archaeon]|nr:hypothetical protein [Candidatus Nezhaarchaeota archaeon]
MRAWRSVYAEGETPIGELDLLVVSEPYELMGIEVTLRRELDGKKERLERVQEEVEKKFFHFEYEILHEDNFFDGLERIFQTKA